MAQFVNIYPVDLQKGPIEVSLNRMYMEDIKANRVGVTVTDGGAAVTLGGTCSATAILSNGSTVAISGTISGNQAYIELPSAVYTVDGPVEVFVNLTNGGVTATLLHGHGTVVQTDTGTVIDPGTIIPSVSALIDDIDTAVASIPADYSALLAAVAPTFSSSTAYTAGRYVWYSGNLYRFTADHAAGTWAGTDAVQVVVTNEIIDLKSALGTKTENQEVEFITGNTVYNFLKNQYIATNGDTANIDNPTSHNGYDSLVVDCFPGDKFVISGYGGGNPRLWAFLGSPTGNTYPVLEPKADVAELANKKTIIAPPSATKLVVNVNNSNSYPYGLCKNIPIIDKLNSTDSDLQTSKTSTNKKIDDIKNWVKNTTGNNNYDFVDGTYIVTSGDTADISTLVPGAGTYSHAVIDCSAGDLFTVFGTGGGSPRLWAFLGAESNGSRPVLTKSGESLVGENLCIEAPTGAQKLVVNAVTANDHSVYSGRLNLNEMNHSVDNIYESLPVTIAENNKRLTRNNNTITVEGECYTDYVSVIPGRKITLKNIYAADARAVCGYFADKSFDEALLTAYNGNEYTLTVPDDIYYIRANGHSGVAIQIIQTGTSIQEVDKLYRQTVQPVEALSRSTVIRRKIFTLIDDDGKNKTAMEDLKSVCDEVGIKCTFACVAKLFEADATLLAFLHELQDEGYHICNHTYDHSRWYGQSEFGPEFTPQQKEEDLIKAIKLFDENGFIDAGKFFVYPGNSYTKTKVPQIIKKWCECACTINWGNNVPDQSSRILLNRNLIDNSWHSEVQYYLDWIDDLEKEGNNWIIFYSHCADPTQYNHNLFKAILQGVIAKGYDIMTLNEAWNYRKAEYMIQEKYGY